MDHMGSQHVGGVSVKQAISIRLYTYEYRLKLEMRPIVYLSNWISLLLCIMCFCGLLNWNFRVTAKIKGIIV